MAAVGPWAAGAKPDRRLAIADAEAGEHADPARFGDALERVGGGRGERHHRLDVLQDAGGEGARGRRQGAAVRRAGAALVPQAEVDVDAAAGLGEVGLGREGRVRAMASCRVADRFARQHHVVAAAQRVAHRMRDLELVLAIFGGELVDAGVGGAEDLLHLRRETRYAARPRQRICGGVHVFQPVDVELLLEADLHRKAVLRLEVIESTAELRAGADFPERAVVVGDLGEIERHRRPVVAGREQHPRLGDGDELGLAHGAERVVGRDGVGRGDAAVGRHPGEAGGEDVIEPLDREGAAAEDRRQLQIADHRGARVLETGAHVGFLSHTAIALGSAVASRSAHSRCPSSSPMRSCRISIRVWGMPRRSPWTGTV